MNKEVKDSLMDLFKDESIAKQKEMALMLNMPFNWPSIDQQVSGKGHVGDYKRGATKHGRLMYFIPGVELENGLKMPGFACHPDMAIQAAKELLRLAEEKNK